MSIEVRYEHDRWGDGRVRHLRVASDCPPDSVSTTPDDDGVHTLHVHPRHAWRADEYRERCEAAIARYWSALD